MAEPNRPERVEIRVKDVEDPLPDATFGSIGRYVEVAGPDGKDERFDPQRVVLRFDEKQSEHVDLWSLMLFEVDLESRAFTPIESSRVDVDKREVTAWLDHAGTYGLIGLPKHPAVLETLRLLDRFGPQLQEEREAGEQGLQERICGLILCADPTKWGGGALPPGNLCDRCLGLDVTFERLPERFLFEREIPLRRFPWPIEEEEAPGGPPILAWGSNGFGNLGDGTTQMQLAPVPVLTSLPMRKIDGGGVMTIFLATDGTVWACGKNDLGQLGNGTFADSKTPRRVGWLTNIVDIAASNDQAFAVRSDGTVWKWGHDPLFGGSTSRLPVQQSGISDVVAIAAGEQFALALKNDGRVWSWGANVFGQLGDGSAFDRANPAMVPGLTAIRAVGAGPESSFAVKSNGDLVAWGSNANATLGDGTRTTRKSPVAVPGVSDVEQISGGYHTLARTTAGEVWVWGEGGTGQAGDGQMNDHDTPVQVPGLQSITGIAAGLNHCLAMKADGTVWAWGWNFSGQVGDGTKNDRLTPFSVPLPAGRNANGVGAGGAWSFAMLG
jgi:alpha-tubulin suppressor-like RCC1 family protein